MTLETTENILLALLVVDALALAVLVLIQQGKGADAGAAFGGGGAGTVFGSAGSGGFLVKVTSWLAIGFFIIAFGLAYTAKERAGTLSELGIPQVTAPLSGLDSEIDDVPTDDMAPAGDDTDTNTTNTDSMETEVIEIDGEESDVPSFDLDGDVEGNVDDQMDNKTDETVEIETSVLTDAPESVDSEIPDV